MDLAFEHHAGRRAGRARLRLAGAVVAATTALLDLLIGLGVLTVVEQVSPDALSLLPFGLSAGALFVVGAALLLAVDHRLLWTLGAALQVVVILLYVAVAPQRTPSYELWGLTIKVLQAVLLAILLYLAVMPAAQDEERSAHRA